MSARVRPEQRRPSAAGKKIKVQPIANPQDLAMNEGLPSNQDAERFVLASILLNDAKFSEAQQLEPDDFSIERHRRIFGSMLDLQALGEHVDCVTVAEELARRNELGPDGLGYLASLTDGMPEIVHLDSYVRIVLNKSTLRRTIFTAQKLANECLLETTAPKDLLASHLGEIQELTRRGSRMGQAIADIPAVRDCVKHEIEYLRKPELPRGAVIGLTGDSGSGKSTLALAWAGEVSAAGIPVLVLDRENPSSVIAERLERLGIRDGGLLRYWGGWLPDPPPQPNDPGVLDWVKSCESRPLIIVDSMVAFHGGDENDAGEMRAFMQQCRTVADLGATALVVHHDGKADTSKDYRGSSDFKASLDEGFHITNLPGSDGRLGTICLRCYKSRFGFSGELLYRYNAGQFVRDQDPSGPSQTISERLTELLRGNPGIKKTAFEKLASDSGLGRNKARDYINSGLLAGKIQRAGKGNQQRHFLVEEPSGEE